MQVNIDELAAQVSQHTQTETDMEVLKEWLQIIIPTEDNDPKSLAAL
jgi:hypothetical protein